MSIRRRLHLLHHPLVHSRLTDVIGQNIGAIVFDEPENEEDITYVDEDPIDEDNMDEGQIAGLNEMACEFPAP